MGPRTNLDERASGIIQFPPHPGPRSSHQPALTLRLWGHLFYYYSHHNNHSLHQNIPTGYLHDIMYTQTRTNYFIKM